MNSKKQAFVQAEEPVLPLDDIQGIAVPGFFKPHQTLVAVSISQNAVPKFKLTLKGLLSRVTSGRAALADRRSFRASSRSKKRNAAAASKSLLAVAFTSQGLQKFTPGASSIPSDAFQQGLAARSAFLGDPDNPKEEGNPTNWKVGGPKKAVDALFVIAGNTRAAVNEDSRWLLKHLKGVGITIVYKENGDVREDLPGHEHFGFDDGVSQPGIRGRATKRRDDFITPRYIARSEAPRNFLFGYPGQDLIWPGVLVLGHPTTSPDPIVPGISNPTIPEWTRNGSFLVFRRLRQDVGLFWRTMREEAARLSKLPGFAGLTDKALAARIVGRWESGAPVNRVPGGDNRALGALRIANNHFRFDSDAAPLKLATSAKDPFPQSKADPAGIVCPWAAHIRKVNTRDSGSDTGGRESTYARRLLRVGIPFGKPLLDRYAEKKDDPQKGERGLLFLSIQSSIEDQFEFLTARWMGDPTRPKSPGGHDILVGQNDAPGENRVRKATIFGSNVQPACVATAAQWIIPTGGDYFFVPSLSALRTVLVK
jgi:Dyp-type peroxidase family